MRNGRWIVFYCDSSPTGDDKLHFATFRDGGLAQEFELNCKKSNLLTRMEFEVQGLVGPVGQRGYSQVGPEPITKETLKLGKKSRKELKDFRRDLDNFLSQVRNKQ